ncbi:serine-aspartate repeat-containing protein C-like [Saccostrea cucullata]|uniref:serine-aspartate repeat-containing protein C-like n=1 Tax=Saccostrea cuccullata TaxID=36930 RepID=UPI002ED3B122
MLFLSVINTSSDSNDRDGKKPVPCVIPCPKWYKKENKDNHMFVDDSDDDDLATSTGDDLDACNDDDELATSTDDDLDNSTDEDDDLDTSTDEDDDLDTSTDEDDDLDTSSDEDDDLDTSTDEDDYLDTSTDEDDDLETSGSECKHLCNDLQGRSPGPHPTFFPILLTL